MADSSENALILALIMANLIAGFGLAIPISKGLCRLTNKRRFFRYFAMLVGIYFLECVAFAWGMCTQVFTISLSFVWGTIFALWLRDSAPAGKIIRTGLFVALYGCLPTISFCVTILAVWIIAGNGLLSVEQAGQFGIPGFVPWPLNTMLGFCVALSAGTIILKTAITTCIVSLIVKARVNSLSGT
jgi:hypothetical protein